MAMYINHTTISTLVFGSYGGLIPSGTDIINTPEKAADTLSNLGNDISGLSNDLEEMENLL